MVCFFQKASAIIGSLKCYKTHHYKNRFLLSVGLGTSALGGDQWEVKSKIIDHLQEGYEDLDGGSDGGSEAGGGDSDGGSGAGGGGSGAGDHGGGSGAGSRDSNGGRGVSGDSDGELEYIDD